MKLGQGQGQINRADRFFAGDVAQFADLIESFEKK